MKIGKIKFSICTFQFAISNITRDVMEAKAPRVNGRLASMDASPVQAIHFNDSRKLQPALATHDYPAHDSRYR